MNKLSWITGNRTRIPVKVENDFYKKRLRLFIKNHSVHKLEEYFSFSDEQIQRLTFPTKGANITQEDIDNFRSEILRYCTIKKFLRYFSFYSLTLIIIANSIFVYTLLSQFSVLFTVWLSITSLLLLSLNLFLHFFKDNDTFKMTLSIFGVTLLMIIGMSSVVASDVVWKTITTKTTNFRLVKLNKNVAIELENGDIYFEKDIQFFNFDSTKSDLYIAQKKNLFNYNKNDQFLMIKNK